MNELEGLIERLRVCFARADRTAPGPFQFVSSVTTINGPAVCVVAIVADSVQARMAAAKSITG